MLPKSSQDLANDLVGLIAIDPLPTHQDQPAAEAGEHDATLAGFLAYLASGHAADTVGDDSQPSADERRMLWRRRFGRLAPTHRWQRPTRLKADVQGLSTQLEQAWRQAKRRIAHAR